MTETLHLLEPTAARRILDAAYRVERAKRELAEAEHEYARIWRRMRKEVYSLSCEVATDESVVVPLARS